MSNAAASLSTYINQAEAADDAAAGDTVNAFGRWTPKEQAAHKRAAEATARAKAAAASPPPAALSRRHGAGADEGADGAPPTEPGAGAAQPLQRTAG
jgi:hypothetical protein